MLTLIDKDGEDQDPEGGAQERNDTRIDNMIQEVEEEEEEEEEEGEEAEEEQDENDLDVVS